MSPFIRVVDRGNLGVRPNTHDDDEHATSRALEPAAMRTLATTTGGADAGPDPRARP